MLIPIAKKTLQGYTAIPFMAINVNGFCLQIITKYVYKTTSLLLVAWFFIPTCMSVCVCMYISDIVSKTSYFAFSSFYQS